MENVRTLILAAGKGTRMKSRNAKVLHRVGGAALVEHVAWAAARVSTSVMAVVGHQADRVREILPDVGCVDQPEQLGTGHAVMCAREAFAGFTGDLLVLPGDVPLIRSETLETLLQFHRAGGFRASILTADVADPAGYGRIVRAGGNSGNEVARIVEDRDAGPDILRIPEINSSIYVFQPQSLFDALSEVRQENSQSEYYLTDVIGILVGAGHKVGACRAANSAEILGINTRRELASIDSIMRRRKCDALMAEGVTIMDPASTFIDSDVQIGADSVIYPFVQIERGTVIGSDVTIHSFTRISNSRIGAQSEVLESCIVSNSSIGEDVRIGPFAHLRMGAALSDTVRVGNFVEVKKSTLGEGVKAMHLAYLGDANIGKNVNIGAGAITCNYDGVNKNTTTIEDDVFIGSDSQLIAPVRIGKGAYVAAGSSITDDVPPGSLAIARGRQVIKENWAKDRKGKG
jgi:bifunctional UDP-N-acetylglucosamine pyrophosphorylase/glucosamine-1-phosphate N-acetyltransferase